MITCLHSGGTMKKWHLFNTVLTDGQGDFSHFVDICMALKNDPGLHDVQLIPVIGIDGYDLDKLQRIKNKLMSLNSTEHYCFFTFLTSFNTYHPLALSLKESEQVLFISADALYPVCQFYIPPGALIKIINEHEGERFFKIPNSNKYPLGLGEKCYGIKISELPKRTLDEAGAIIREYDPHFYNRLLKQTNANSFQELYDKNLVIPAYFNKFYNGFAKFLTLLVIQVLHGSSPQGLVIYYSGKNLFKSSGYNIYDLAADLNIRIECIRDDKVVVVNPNSERTVKIFIGAYICDQSYDALFSCAEIVGVSGDNTLESSVAHQVLPFYMSTNFDIKRPTLEMLQKISQQPEIPISGEARDSFNVYFDPSYYMEEHFILKSKHLNLFEMMKNWPIIASYLKEHRNFYSHLKDICLAGISRDLTRNNSLSDHNASFFSQQRSAEFDNASGAQEDIIISSDEYQLTGPGSK